MNQKLQKIIFILEFFIVSENWVLYSSDSYIYCLDETFLYMLYLIH